MFGSVILDVAIGIIFVYILISLICSAIRESIEAFLKTRAAYLERGIRELLNDRKAENIAKAFFEHPMISGLYASEYTPGKDTKTPGVLDSGKNLPSYIPSRNFALALIDIAARGARNNAATSGANAPVISIESIRSNILNIQNQQVQRALLTALDNAQGDLDRLRGNLEDWFNSSMDRVSGWYKRSTQWILFWVGLMVAIVLNVNTITIADYLFRNEDQRKLIVAEAERATQDTAFLRQGFAEARGELAKLKLPMGWESGLITPNCKCNDGWATFWNCIAIPILGWLLTALAASLGAPFWFDLLNKVMVIRATVKPAEKSGEEGSEDRKSDRQSPVIIQMSPEKVNQPPAVAAVAAAVAEGGAVLDSESDIDSCLTNQPAPEDDEDQPTGDDQLPPASGGVS